MPGLQCSVPSMVPLPLGPCPSAMKDGYLAQPPQGWAAGCGGGGQTGGHGCIRGVPHPIRAPLSQASWEHADKHVGPGRGLACLGWGRSHREAQGGLKSMPACPENASLSLCHRALEDPSLWSGIKQGCSRDAWKHLRTD